MERMPRIGASPSALYNFRANLEARACVQVRRDYQGWHAASRPICHAGMLARVDLLARSAGGIRAAAPLSTRRWAPQGVMPAPHEGRAPRRGARWHGICTRSIPWE